MYEKPQEKVDKLRSLNACTLCSYGNHETKACQFKFSSRCRLCQGFHFTYLCVAKKNESKPGNASSSSVKTETPVAESSKDIPKSNKGKGEGKNSTLNGIAITEVLRNITCDDPIILPTFTCEIKGVGNSLEPVRVLMDGGCQRNFIDEKIAIDNNLKVLNNNVGLDIHGFNTTKTVETKRVLVPLRVGNETVNIEALCMPEIRTKLSIDGLDKIINSFLCKGYSLADKELREGGHEEIGNIGIILGEDGDYVLKTTTMSYGRGTESTYYDTCLGVVLRGNVDRILSNIQYLPYADNIQESPMNNTNSGSLTVVIESNESPDSVQLVQGRENIDYSSLCANKISCKDVLVECRDLSDLDSEEIPRVYGENENASTNSNLACSVVNDRGQVLQSELKRATEEALNEQCARLLDVDQNLVDSEETETNQKLVDYVLNRTERDAHGRLIMPLIWNNKNVHLLGKNYNLSQKILHSNVKKLKKIEGRIEMVDSVFREQEELGIIERIEDITAFMQEHPECSFLPHMAIFKPDRDTTKVRAVFLSNLCEKTASEPYAVSNNQAMLVGPCLNHKITTSILLLRFDTKLILFDIKKAFLNISLRETDQNRLMFLWYRNVGKGDFSLIAYRNLRLPFGLRSSPCLLMLGLYKILMMDNDNDDENLINLKKSIFNVIYMDNGGFSSNDTNTLYWSYEMMQKIFEEYKFSLQQFTTNDLHLQNAIDEELGIITPTRVKVLGMTWDRELDTFSPLPIVLDPKANTKRLIMSSLKSVYDVFNILAPIMNRGNLFLQKLVNDKSLDWDTVLPDSLRREWNNIVKQANATPQVSIPRFVGRRDSEYKLVAFTDSSKVLYATVIYLVDTKTNEVSFCRARNRVVGSQLEKKTIPTLEFLGICLGVETLMEVYQDLSGSSTVIPITVKELELYTDSMVSLHWLQSYAYKYDKMQKRSVFIMNRLRAIDELCKVCPVTFNFVEGFNNPADCLTRPFSHKQLLKTNYFSGPEFLKSKENVKSDFSLLIPNPLARNIDEVPEDEASTNLNCYVGNNISKCEDNVSVELGHLVLMDKFSSFHTLVMVHRYILRFINNIKIRLAEKNKLTHLKRYDYSKDNLYAIACNNILLTEQRIHFPEVFEYFQNEHRGVQTMPNLVGQLNLFQSKDYLLRVKSKFHMPEQCKYPILLPKHSKITKLIIKDLHERYSHAGIYTLLKELRRTFWITHYYSTVRKVIRECVVCKRLNERPIQLNQSDYRDFRVEPPSVPFRYIFIDYMGPYQVIWNGEKTKVWILIITCLWSRAVNMKICLNADVKFFLRALQLHVFEFGLFELCLSDLGSQIVAGTNLIKAFLDDFETQNYFEKNGIKPVKFNQYCKGNSSLGALVESCVKLTKKLLYGAIRNNVLDYLDFEFIIHQTTHLVNKRPIAFKDGLRSKLEEDTVNPITPEILLKGYDLPSLNLIPELQLSPDDNDPDWVNADNFPEVIRSNHLKLSKVRERLIDAYHSEFLANLVKQAVDKQDRYKPVPHKGLRVGDIVLIKEKHLKPTTYPLGIVKKIETNTLGEVTAATIFKGKTRELVCRHATTLILLIPNECSNDDNNTVEDSSNDDSSNCILDSELPGDARPLRRKAAIECQNKTNDMIQKDLV